MTRNGSTSTARRGTRRKMSYSPAPAWHNMLFGLLSAGLTFGLLLVPGVTYVDLFLGVESTAVLILTVLLLAGLFQPFLGFMRREDQGRHR